MKHQVKIQVKSQSVAVERFLRVTRHRGFNLTNMSLVTEQGQYQVVMDVESERPLYLLTQQLEKLIDVSAVEVATSSQAVSSC